MPRVLALPLLFLLVLPAAAQERLMTPAAFLGYELGERFTPHHRVVDYVEHVAQTSPNVLVERYGETYEGRPLLVAYVATPEHLARLDAIREDNLRRAGVLPGEADAEAPAVVWLSYNVHGNEAVSMEAAMATLYDLADTGNAQTQGWLDDVVVVLDPALNPDGRDRYASWFHRTVGADPDPRPITREHHEPWPGGRTNHYYFDLNRDWAWATQQETQHRLALYNRWLPQIHVDFHEQGVDEPYYFAPAAEPFHTAITDWQRDFQTEIGENHLNYFDEAGRLYFTRQRFDLLYPGYGDTWPTFNGAIGMTYEQGGSGRAGLAIITAEGDTLTLRERIENHHATGLSTVEVSARNRARLVAEFERYFEDNGVPQSFVVKGSPDRLTALARHLDREGIRYGYADGPRALRGVGYADGASARFEAAPGDLVVSTRQPKGTLARVLFEPRTEVVDSITYDITAWALPYVYGLEAYAVEGDVAAGGSAPRPEPPTAPRGRAYAYLADWESVEDLKLLAALLEEDVKLRFAERPFEVEGRDYDRGTLIITRTGNEGMGARFDEVVQQAAQTHGQPLHAVSTGFVARGADFGSSDVPFLRRPEVAVLAGDGVSPYALGEVWHFFDQTLDYPLALLDTDGFDVADLDHFDVLLLAHGSYGEIFDEDALTALRAWVRRGGRLVAMEGAVSFLVGKEGFEIARKEVPEDTTAAPEQRRYADEEREAISGGVPGSIYRVSLDETHPLGFGLGTPEDGAYYTLKRSADAYAYLDDGWNVGVLPPDAHVSGFTGYQAAERLEDVLAFGVQEMGRGEVVYLVDNPLFRGFWYGGQLLLGNAVFLVGQRTTAAY